MREKIIGYILLIFGIFIIIFSLFNVYRMFNNKNITFKIFNFSGISLDLTEFLNTELPQDQIEQIKQEKGLKTDLISPQLINQPLNLIVTLLFFTFSVNVGFKLSQLGIQLLRPIKVKLNKES